MSGSLTIENAARIREELIRAFGESEKVVLELREDVTADVAFLQMLCSAHRSAVREKKTFELDWSAAPAVGELLADAGYSCDEPCLARADEDRNTGRGDANE